MEKTEKYLLKMDKNLFRQLSVYKEMTGGSKAKFLREQAKKALIKFISEEATKDNKLIQTMKDWKEQNK